jgi:hypothetical protein
MINLQVLLRQLSAGASVRALARFFSRSTGSIANRIDRLARQAMCTLNELVAMPTVAEDLAADGFRTFTVSQFFPCDVTVLIGCDTDTVYALDYALLRRSGSMRPGQKSRREQIDRVVPFDPQATQKSFSRILDTVVRLSLNNRLTARALRTDRHPAYHTAWSAHSHILHLQARSLLALKTTSSKAARTAANPLRAVNYIDREIRKDRADHHRQTVCHARNVCAMLNRLVLYLVYHNIMKKKRIRGSRSPTAVQTIKDSHALHAGIGADTQARWMIELLTSRRFLSLTNLPWFSERLWRKQIPTPLAAGREYLPKYALA